MPRKDIRQKLEDLGEPKVRQMLAAGDRILGDVDSAYQYEVLLWLAEKAEVRLEARSNETISVAREANSVAREANTIAMSAAVSASDANDIARSAKKYTLIAAIAAIVAAIAAIKWR